MKVAACVEDIIGIYRERHESHKDISKAGKLHCATSVTATGVAGMTNGAVATGCAAGTAFAPANSMGKGIPSRRNFPQWRRRFLQKHGSPGAYAMTQRCTLQSVEVVHALRRGKDSDGVRCAITQDVLPRRSWV